MKTHHIIILCTHSIVSLCFLISCMISGFHHNTDKICALLGYYAAYSANSLPMFQDNLLVPTSKVKISKFARPLTMEPVGCHTTLARNYCYTLHNIPEEQNPFLISYSVLKSILCEAVTVHSCIVT
jgi:hypothetical protein